jgi:hypothetical protein
MTHDITQTKHFKWKDILLGKYSFKRTNTTHKILRFYSWMDGRTDGWMDGWIDR